MTNKQRKTIKIAEYFSKPVELSETNLSFYRALEAVEDKNGISPEKAFLQRTDRGITKMHVNGVAKYLSLLVGHNSAAMHAKMWSEGFKEGTLFMEDFDDEPDYIKEMALKAKLISGTSSYDYIKKLTDSEWLRYKKPDNVK